MWSHQRLIFLQWSLQIDDYNQRCAQTLSIIKIWNCVVLLGKLNFNFFSLAMVPIYVITQETLLGCILEMLENITNSTKMLEKGG